jgi:hypothetical protein
MIVLLDKELGDEDFRRKILEKRKEQMIIGNNLKAPWCNSQNLT